MFLVAACLDVLLVTGCQKELGVVTIEGDIAPELDVRGDIYFSTFHPFFFCKRNLLQAPNPKDKTVHAKFERVRDRYKLVYDSRYVPRGGICDWRPDGIRVEVTLRSRDIGEGTLLHLIPIGATNRYTKDRPRQGRVMQVACDIDYSRNPPDPDCDLLKRVLDDTGEDVHLTLNVTHEKGHKPVHD